MQPPLALWPCQLFPRDRKKRKKKNLFHVCGKAEIGWDQALEIWEPDIKSALFLFHAMAPAESLCRWLVVLVASFLQPASQRFLSAWRTDFTNWTERHSAAVASSFRLAHITLSAVPLAKETSRITVCERALPLFWRVKTIRRLYCPFPCWDLTHPVYWKEFTGDSWSPMEHDPVLNH